MDKEMIVDRIEGKFAVCETKAKMIKILLTELPANLKEGDVLYWQEEKNKYVIDDEKTCIYKKNIVEKCKDLWC